LGNTDKLDFTFDGTMLLGWDLDFLMIFQPQKLVSMPEFTIKLRREISFSSYTSLILTTDKTDMSGVVGGKEVLQIYFPTYTTSVIEVRLEL